MLLGHHWYISGGRGMLGGTGVLGARGEWRVVIFRDESVRLYSPA